MLMWDLITGFGFAWVFFCRHDWRIQVRSESETIEVVNLIAWVRLTALLGASGLVWTRLQDAFACLEMMRS
jgi:hypothetical protein